MKIQFAFIFTLLGLQGVAQSVVVANKTFLQVDKTVECHEEVVLSGIGTSSCISTICTVIEEGGDVLAIFDGLNIYDAKGRVINEGRDFRTQSVSSQSITAITGDFGVNLYHLGFENFAMRPLYVSKLSFVNGELEIVGKNEFILEGDFAYLKSITNSLGRSSLLVYDIGGEELITSDVTDGELSDLKRHNLVLDGFNSSGRDDLGALAVSNQGNQLFLTSGNSHEGYLISYSQCLNSISITDTIALSDTNAKISGAAFSKYGNSLFTIHRIGQGMAQIQQHFFESSSHNEESVIIDSFGIVGPGTDFIVTLEHEIFYFDVSAPDGGIRIIDQLSQSSVVSTRRISGFCGDFCVAPTVAVAKFKEPLVVDYFKDSMFCGDIDYVIELPDNFDSLVLQDRNVYFGESLLLSEEGNSIIGLYRDGCIVEEEITLSKMNIDTVYSDSTYCVDLAENPELEFLIGSDSTIYETVSTPGSCFSVEALSLTVTSCDRQLTTDFYIPNVFSPNGDGVNDEWFLGLPENFDKKIITAMIFDRWGGVVVDLMPSLSWDGTFGGDKILPGVYTVLIELEDSDQVQTREVGIVTIIR